MRRLQVGPVGMKLTRQKKKPVQTTKTLTTRVSYIVCGLFPIYAAALCSASYKKPQVS